MTDEPEEKDMPDIGDEHIRRYRQNALLDELVRQAQELGLDKAPWRIE